MFSSVLITESVLGNSKTLTACSAGAFARPVLLAEPFRHNSILPTEGAKAKLVFIAESVLANSMLLTACSVGAFAIQPVLLGEAFRSNGLHVVRNLAFT